MWPEKIRPYVGSNESDVEPFDEWHERVREYISHVPDSVAKEWNHRHWRHSPYEHLPLSQMHFERQTWPLARLGEVKFGKDWGESAADLTRLDQPMVRQAPLAQMMLRDKTWPAPIIVLDNADGAQVHRGVPMARWHLLEGHQRLSFLRCLEHKNDALPYHDVWVVMITPATADKEPVPDRHPDGDPRPTYAHEKLSNAIRSLAIEPGSLHERLASAFEGGIDRVPAHDFPADMRERWELLVAAGASCSILGERAASHFAREIVEFHEWVCYRLGDYYLD
jgi:hypothetical protein